MDASKLPQWKCHKIVRAAQIKKIEAARMGAQLLTIEAPNPPTPLSLCEYLAKQEMLVRYVPVIGDYLVVYEDGYVSFSPAKAFEEGYTRMESTT